MHILCTGINHQTATVDLRERLAFSEERLTDAFRLFEAQRCQGGALQELVILSTCNRVELYAVSQEGNEDGLTVLLSQVSCLPQEAFRSHLYEFFDEQAVEHLFRVAAGLDSLVLGEAQILGQVGQALETARSKGSTGPVLSRLFQTAVFTGKRARTETHIGHNPASISSIAVSLAARAVPNLGEANVAILGAGEMAELAVDAFLKRGVRGIRVVNRHVERAQQLASRWEGVACTFDALPDILEQADIILCSTGAPHALVHPEMVRRALRTHPTGRLVLIDIAVPRDVHPDVKELAGVSVYDMDALQERLEHSLAGREQEIPKVEAIVQAELAIFQEYLDGLDLLPIIAQIHQQAEALRRAELEKTLRRLPHLSPEERRRIDALTNALVNKILSAPLGRLKTRCDGSRSADYAMLARDLFGLGD
jgi:glutamyl-tRNA reductase